MSVIHGIEIADESHNNVEDLQLLARRNWQIRAERMRILEKPIKENDKTSNN